MQCSTRTSIRAAVAAAAKGEVAAGQSPPHQAAATRIEARPARGRGASLRRCRRLPFGPLTFFYAPHGCFHAVTSRQYTVQGTEGLEFCPLMD